MKWKLLLLIFFSVLKLSSNAQLKLGDQPTIQDKSVALDVKGSNARQGLWLPRITDTSNVGIDGLNPPDGMIIYHTPTQNVLLRVNGFWMPLVKADTSINNIYVNNTTKITGPDVKFKVGNSPGTTNDFNLAGSTSLKEVTINLPDASSNTRGAVNALPQTFGGKKTFTDSLRADGALTVSGSQGINGATSKLTLGLTSTTIPEGTTDKFLSVNASGQVTLNAANIVTNNAIKIKTYFKNIASAPVNLNANTPTRYFFSFAGQNLSTTSSVVITPLFEMKVGTAILYSRVVDINTIEMVMMYHSVGGTQPVTAGTDGLFNITVIEF